MALLKGFREVFAVELVDLGVRGDNTLRIDLNITIFFHSKSALYISFSLCQQKVEACISADRHLVSHIVFVAVHIVYHNLYFFLTLLKGLFVLFCNCLAAVFVLDHCP